MSRQAAFARLSSSLKGVG